MPDLSPRPDDHSQAIGKYSRLARHTRYIMIKPLRSPIAVLPELNTIESTDSYCPMTVGPSQIQLRISYSRPFPRAKTSGATPLSVLAAIDTARSLSIRLPIVFQNA